VLREPTTVRLPVPTRFTNPAAVGTTGFVPELGANESTAGPDPPDKVTNPVESTEKAEESKCTTPFFVASAAATAVDL
jgi:hypothetical protein